MAYTKESFLQTPTPQASLLYLSVVTCQTVTCQPLHLQTLCQHQSLHTAFMCKTWRHTALSPLSGSKTAELSRTNIEVTSLKSVKHHFGRIRSQSKRSLGWPPRPEVRLRQPRLFRPFKALFAVEINSQLQMLKAFSQPVSSKEPQANLEGTLSQAVLHNLSWKLLNFYRTTSQLTGHQKPKASLMLPQRRHQMYHPQCKLNFFSQAESEAPLWVAHRCKLQTYISGKHCKGVIVEELGKQEGTTKRQQEQKNVGKGGATASNSLCSGQWRCGFWRNSAESAFKEARPAPRCSF